MVYPIGKRILFPIVRLWIGKIKGIENIPRNGQFIISANHTSYMDHFCLGYIVVPHLNKKLHFLAKKEHFNNIAARIWHRYAGAIPVDRESGGKKALRWAAKALKEGKIIGIYPEGTRSLSGRLQKAKTGVARLALEAKVPVVPVGLIGNFEILPKGKLVPKLKKATINIGTPIHFTEYQKKAINKRALRKATNQIMKEIAGLCKQEYTKLK
ncbi:1-acyl-sn-glycerol-3-phosphate acyltransferase [Candidatus Woesearchaeota archaeon]|nr:1-acyl-sn-glycerol-3-phosphate acyltransferase [Candidatus Woesearchaeota archaeon]